MYRIHGFSIVIVVVSMTEFTVPHLPVRPELESLAVLRQAAVAHRYLAELKGMAAAIPNESILISALSLQEAKDSSEIENIVTTTIRGNKTKCFVIIPL